MAYKFSLDKKGYNQEEVNEYINNLYLKYEEKLAEQKDRLFALKNELDKVNARLEHYIEKDKQISQALIYAVEKADEIESGAKKIYELEIKRVRLLYKRWEELLLEVESKYPQVNTNQHIKQLIESFKDSINDVLEENFHISNQELKNSHEIKQNLKNNGSNYIKNILNKMEYVFNQKENDLVETRVAPAKPKNSKSNIKSVVSNHEKESNRLVKISSKIKKIAENASGQDLVESYLNSDFDDSFTSSAYAKSITRKTAKNDENESPFNYPYPEPNESGFDLKEALNPKEELEEIMSAFDFFNDKD